MKLNRFGKWGLSSFNGILMIGFGIVAIAFPSITIATLAIYFAVAIILGGLTLTSFSLKHKDEQSNWKTRLTEGIVSVILGLVIVIKPLSAVNFLVIIVGIWAFFIGSVFIVSYFSRKAPDMVGALNLIAGVISLLLGIVVIFDPFQSGRVLVILIGVYALAYGIFTMIYTTQFFKSKITEVQSDE